MFEHRSHPLLSTGQFALRMLRMFGVTVAIVVASLVIGASGYHFLAGDDWSRAILHACLILAGHDVTPKIDGYSAHLFVGFFVLYARLVFVALVGILMSPVLHRIYHRIHHEDCESAKADESRDATADANP